MIRNENDNQDLRIKIQSLRHEMINSRGNHLEWESDNTLRIENWDEYSNETITLNIDEEIYDGWGWACSSLRTKDKYVRCLTPES